MKTKKTEVKVTEENRVRKFGKANYHIFLSHTHTHTYKPRRDFYDIRSYLS